MIASVLLVVVVNLVAPDHVVGAIKIRNVFNEVAAQSYLKPWLVLEGEGPPGDVGLPSSLQQGLPSGADLLRSDARCVSRHYPCCQKSQINVANAKDGRPKTDSPKNPSGPEHTLGPLRHLPLGVQILLGALGLAGLPFGIVYTVSRTVETNRNIEAFAVFYLGLIALGVVSGMLLVGALVAL
jgi:hypothetical protein